MSDASRDFHKPVRRSPDSFDRNFAADDPAEASRVAHATASALLSRVREQPHDEVIDRLVTFTDAHGIATIAELWAQSPARSLPGALWRLYLLQLMIHDDPATSALLYERGRTRLSSADVVIAGAPTPASPDELVSLIDLILRGVFAGDFALALERAAAFSRVVSAGATDLADDYDESEPGRASQFTTRALRLDTYAGDLTAAAALWRRDGLT
ncbi:DNA-directed RNA polymerase subunit beta [Microbacterium oleivorans]|uniref:DNA-directed RNA polymerase subunit beta n=1 Tax=Microbacterium oleivorans TaxID=273677 RepID=UPI0020405021|nr:DNA-directed RNA polymerase subunit beta [Microbacterium oleivorans]MCM3697335.1 DNA-directed RNA polymerase subunit beta [Microbacterium oleivorans]